MAWWKDIYKKIDTAAGGYLPGGITPEQASEQKRIADAQAAEVKRIAEVRKAEQKRINDAEKVRKRAAKEAKKKADKEKADRARKRLADKVRRKAQALKDKLAAEAKRIKEALTKEAKRAAERLKADNLRKVQDEVRRKAQALKDKLAAEAKRAAERLKADNLRKVQDEVRRKAQALKDKLAAEAKALADKLKREDDQAIAESKRLYQIAKDKAISEAKRIKDALDKEAARVAARLKKENAEKIARELKAKANKAIADAKRVADKVAAESKRIADVAAKEAKRLAEKLKIENAKKAFDKTAREAKALAKRLADKAAKEAKEAKALAEKIAKESKIEAQRIADRAIAEAKKAAKIAKDLADKVAEKLKLENVRKLAVEAKDKADKLIAQAKIAAANKAKVAKDLADKAKVKADQLAKEVKKITKKTYEKVDTAVGGVLPGGVEFKPSTTPVPTVTLPGLGVGGVVADKLTSIVGPKPTVSKEAKEKVDKVIKDVWTSVDETVFKGHLPGGAETKEQKYREQRVQEEIVKIQKEKQVLIDETKAEGARYIVQDEGRTEDFYRVQYNQQLDAQRKLDEASLLKETSKINKSAQYIYSGDTTVPKDFYQKQYNEQLKLLRQKDNTQMDKLTKNIDKKAQYTYTKNGKEVTISGKEYINIIEGDSYFSKKSREGRLFAEGYSPDGKVIGGSEYINIMKADPYYTKESREGRLFNKGYSSTGRVVTGAEYRKVINQDPYFSKEGMKATATSIVQPGTRTEYILGKGDKEKQFTELIPTELKVYEKTEDVGYVPVAKTFVSNIFKRADTQWSEKVIKPTFKAASKITGTDIPAYTERLGKVTGKVVEKTMDVVTLGLAGDVSKKTGAVVKDIISVSTETVLTGIRDKPISKAAEVGLWAGAGTAIKAGGKVLATVSKVTRVEKIPGYAGTVKTTGIVLGTGMGVAYAGTVGAEVYAAPKGERAKKFGEILGEDIVPMIAGGYLGAKIEPTLMKDISRPFKELTLKAKGYKQIPQEAISFKEIKYPAAEKGIKGPEFLEKQWKKGEVKATGLGGGKVYKKKVSIPGEEKLRFSEKVKGELAFHTASAPLKGEIRIGTSREPGLYMGPVASTPFYRVGKVTKTPEVKLFGMSEVSVTKAHSPTTHRLLMEEIGTAKQIGMPEKIIKARKAEIKAGEDVGYKGFQTPAQKEMMKWKLEQQPPTKAVLTERFELIKRQELEATGRVGVIYEPVKDAPKIYTKLKGEVIPMKYMKPTTRVLTPEVAIRVRATAIVKTKKGTLLHYAPEEKAFITPGGGVSKGESVLKAAERELFEETGLKAVKTKYIGSVEGPIKRFGSKDPYKYTKEKFEVFEIKATGKAKPLSAEVSKLGYYREGKKMKLAEPTAKILELAGVKKKPVKKVKDKVSKKVKDDFDLKIIKPSKDKPTKVIEKVKEIKAKPKEVEYVKKMKKGEKTYEQIMESYKKVKYKPLPVVTPYRLALGIKDYKKVSPVKEYEPYKKVDKGEYKIILPITERRITPIKKDEYKITPVKEYTTPVAAPKEEYKPIAPVEEYIPIAPTEYYQKPSTYRDFKPITKRYTPIAAKPFLKGDGKSKKKVVKRISKKQGYDAYAKIQKTRKWKKLNTVPLTEARAKDMGSYLSDHTLSAQYKIKKANKKKAQTTELNVPRSYSSRTAKKFRDYRIRKGKKIPMKNRYIEKRGKRLDTRGETRKITLYKKLQEMKKVAKKSKTKVKKIKKGGFFFR